MKVAVEITLRQYKEDLHALPMVSSSTVMVLPAIEPVH